MKNVKCQNCGTVHDGNFCPNCAAPAPVKKKKKGFLLPVILVLCALILFACAGGDSEPKQPASVTPDVDTATEGTEARQEEDTTAAAAEAVSIAETVLYNDHGVVVTAKEISEGMFGPEISVLIENNSDKNVTVTTRDLSVNSYMFTASGLFSDIAAGKKAMETLTLMSSEMQEAGIETVAQVDFCLHIYDSDTFGDIADSDLITLQTSVAGSFEQPVDDSGDLVYEGKDVRVVCKGLKDDLIWDGMVVFFVENNRDEAITVCTENVSVNGFMVDESMWTELRPGTRAVSGMYLLSIEELGIEDLEEVENIEFALRILDDDWDEIATSDVITLNFE